MFKPTRKTTRRPAPRRRHFRSRRPAEPRLSRGHLQACGLSVVFAVGLGLLVLGNGLGPPERDQAGCVVGTAPGKSVMVLVDLTDRAAPSSQQMKALDSEIRARLVALEVGDRLSVLVLASDGTRPADTTILFSHCKPRPKGNELYENANTVERAYEAKWARPLADLPSQVAAHAGKGAPNTPLMATVMDLARSPMFPAESERHLIVMTDLLEHDPEPQHLSFYRKPIPSLAQIRAQELRIARNDGILAGAQAHFLVVTNGATARHQTEEVRAFWKAWLRAGKIAALTFDQI